MEEQRDEARLKRLTALADRLINRKILKEAEGLTADDVRFLIEEMTTVSSRPPMPLVEVDPPVVVCGDMHGQYDDLIRVIRRFGSPPKTRYLFLGDYVDRGPHSIETICSVFAMKAAYPNHFFALRGNHETKDVNRLYGFLEECERRFPGEKLWEAANEVFLWLPLAALVGDRIFCAHGGISRDLLSWNDLRKVQLPMDIPDTGIVADVLWSDPSDTTIGFVASGRGQGHLFGPDAVEQFCQRMEVDLIIRAHQVHATGYRIFSEDRLITVFSAPNYGGFLNDAAVVFVDENMLCHIEILPPLSKKYKGGAGDTTPVANSP